MVIKLYLVKQDLSDGAIKQFSRPTTLTSYRSSLSPARGGIHLAVVVLGGFLEEVINWGNGKDE